MIAINFRYFLLQFNNFGRKKAQRKGKSIYDYGYNARESDILIGKVLREADEKAEVWHRRWVQSASEEVKVNSEEKWIN